MRELLLELFLLGDLEQVFFGFLCVFFPIS